MAILFAGQRLGSYAVEDLLGTGGMAEVYRATHTTLERPVAIKVINPSFNADPTFLLRFLREAKAVARLSHPNIITVYDFGEQGELAYLVMEIATGGTFKERARRFRTLAEAVEELAPIGDALEYAHRNGIVHRDLKPINLLITEEERLLLADFGLARVASESLDLGETDGGMILGTPYYMAPEQALGEDVDPRADIYAFGILTYEVLAGRVPYDGTTALAVLQQHLKAPPPSIRAVIPQAPETLERAIARATAKRRENRFDGAAQFVEELRRAAREAPDLPVAAALASPAPAAEQPTRATSRPVAESLAETLIAPQPVVEEIEPGFTPRPGILPRPATPEQTPAMPASEATVTPPAAAGVEPGGTQFVTPPPRPAAEPQPAATPVAPAPERVPDADVPEVIVQRAPLERRKRLARRSSRFTAAQWLLGGIGVLVVLAINVAGYYVWAQGGRHAVQGQFAADLTTWIWDKLDGLKSLMALLALIAAAIAVLTMRTAIIDDRHLSPRTYRKLRQYHRVAGWAAIWIALAVGFLTCFGIFGFGTGSWRLFLHSLLGTALVAVIFAKIAIVRYYPAQRRYLSWLGHSLLGLFFLVFLTSAVPFAWQHIHGSSGPGQYGAAISRPLR
jgi:serine/threonine protein kinase